MKKNNTVFWVADPFAKLCDVGAQLVARSGLIAQQVALLPQRVPGAKQIQFAGILLAVLLSLPQTVLAGEAAGTILTFSGEVEVLRGEEKIPAAKRGELKSGDIVVTGTGRVQIRFADGTMLTLYNSTRFSVDEYRFERGKNDRARFSLLNGLMHTLTGQMDKRNYLLRTRMATLGVRGTEYSVMLNNALHVSVDAGRVELSNAGGSIQIGAGQSAIVTGPNVMPKPSTGGKIAGVGVPSSPKNAQQIGQQSGQQASGMMQPGMMQPGMMQPGMMQPGMMQPGNITPGMGGAGGMTGMPPPMPPGTQNIGGQPGGSLPPPLLKPPPQPVP